MKTEPVAAVINAFHIIEMLSENDSLGVAEITKALGGSKTTVHRLIQSLVEVGMVSQDNESKRYKLTCRLFELGSKVFGNSNLVQAANGPMTRLNDLTEETVHLGVMETHVMVYLHKLDSKHTLRLASRVGKIAPLHCTALGKVMLAWKAPHQLASILPELNYEVRTPNTIRTPEEFEEHLKQVRKQGYSVDQEENEAGVVCFAVPVFNFDGQTVAGLSVSVPKFRLEESGNEMIIEQLINTGREVSQNLGFSGANYPLS